jgi:hypothetical protein
MAVPPADRGDPAKPSLAACARCQYRYQMRATYRDADAGRATYGRAEPASLRQGAGGLASAGLAVGRRAVFVCGGLVSRAGHRGVGLRRGLSGGCHSNARPTCSMGSGFLAPRAAWALAGLMRSSSDTAGRAQLESDSSALRARTKLYMPVTLLRRGASFGARTTSSRLGRGGRWLPHGELQRTLFYGYTGRIVGGDAEVVAVRTFDVDAIDV